VPSVLELSAGLDDRPRLAGELHQAALRRTLLLSAPHGVKQNDGGERRAHIRSETDQNATRSRQKGGHLDPHLFEYLGKHFELRVRELRKRSRVQRTHPYGSFDLRFYARRQLAMRVVQRSLGCSNAISHLLEWILVRVSQELQGRPTLRADPRVVGHVPYSTGARSVDRELRGGVLRICDRRVSDHRDHLILCQRFLSTCHFGIPNINALNYAPSILRSATPRTQFFGPTDSNLSTKP